jgi:hypothetical protein
LGKNQPRVMANNQTGDILMRNQILLQPKYGYPIQLFITISEGSFVCSRLLAYVIRRLVVETGQRNRKRTVQYETYLIKKQKIGIVKHRSCKLQFHLPTSRQPTDNFRLPIVIKANLQKLFSDFRSRNTSQGFIWRSLKHRQFTH